MSNTEKILTITASICLLALYGCGSGCPGKEKMKASISTLLPVDLEVLEVGDLKEVSGLCEVVVKTNNMPVVFYVDKKGKYVISGSIVDLATKRNLTAEKQRKYAPPAQPTPPAKPPQEKKQQNKGTRK